MSTPDEAAPAGPAPAPQVAPATPASDWDIRRPHRMWPRMLVIVLTLAGLVVLVQFLQGISSIIAPVFLGLNLVIVAYPLQRWLIERGVHPVLGATATVLLVVTVLAVFVGLIFWSGLELVSSLPEYTGRFQAIMQDVSAWLSSQGLTPDMVNAQLQAVDIKQVTGAAVTALTAIASNVYAVVGLLITVVMGMFFLAMDSMAVERRVRLLSSARREFGQALMDFAGGVRRYWVVTTVFGLIVAVLDVVALLVIGVPMALVWGVLSFLTNYVPNIGFIIGLIPPAILGLAEGGWPAFLGVVISYSVLNFVLQSIIQPKVAGDAIGVIPTVSFLSLLFWAWVLGPLGAILALPCTLLAKAILIDADPNARWINSLIASDLKGMERRQSTLLARLRGGSSAEEGSHTREEARGVSVGLSPAEARRAKRGQPPAGVSGVGERPEDAGPPLSPAPDPVAGLANGAAPAPGR
ncbi:AI-2E family transporter [Micrococcaceae bacterium Sec6.3]